jgi:hypothetical protein
MADFPEKTFYAGSLAFVRRGWGTGRQNVMRCLTQINTGKEPRYPN